MPATSHSSIDAEFRVGPIDRRLFGSLVEHIGRCVYGGVYEAGSELSDEDGFRTDVVNLTKELGTTVVRYPGGNFVSGYRWEDGVGPPDARPERLDLAWRSLESNRFSLHEFMAWAAKAQVEPMMAVNFGTRGLQEACDLLEYSNHPARSALAEQRRQNGSKEAFDVKLWCLGNEVDGPWQLGHKTADAYGALAAETAKAMRQVDPCIELVVCGSSNPHMPTFGSWESTVLDHTLEAVDFISVHAYFESHGDDAASFLASGWAMDNYIDAVVATADNVAAKKGLRKRLRLAFDECNVWFQSPHPDHTGLEIGYARRLNEDRYSGLDAVVVGGLMMSLLRHADRVGVACLAQLVNVIAPIWAEPGQPAWRQTIFWPLALSARFGRGETLDVRTRGDTLSTGEHGDVPVVDVVATIDDSTGDIAIFVLNRQPVDQAQFEVVLRGFGPLQLTEHLCLGGPADRDLINTAGRPDAVVARWAQGARPDAGVARATLEPASWNMLRLGGIA